MRPKPNRTYNSDDLAILSRVLKEAVKEKIDGAAISDPEALKQAAVESVGAR